MNRSSKLRVAKRAFIASTLCGLFLALSVTSASAGIGLKSDVTPLDHVLSVQFKDGTTAGQRRRARNASDTDFEQNLAAPGVQQLSVDEGDSVAEAAIALRSNPNVEFVSEPGTWQAADATNDPYLWTQWALDNYGQDFACQPYPNPDYDPNQPPGPSNPVNLCHLLSGSNDADVDAPEAWSIASTGSEAVAVIDTGVAYQHSDLASTIYSNSAEANGIPLIDDDFNGYVDDTGGWDFIGDLQVGPPGPDNPVTPQDESTVPTFNRLAPDNQPRDPDGHGTHVASILGAAPNNSEGIAGVDPRAKILPLRAADEKGLFTWPAIQQAVSYAIDQGVRVINGSFGGPSDDAIFDAIVEAHPEVLFVFSAGNGGGDHIGDNHNDASGTKHEYPCDVPADNVICVAATDWTDKKANYSDYGYDSVDIAAPGSAVFGAWPKWYKPYCTDPATLQPTGASNCSDSPADHTEDGLGGGSAYCHSGICGYKFLDGTSMATPMVSGAAALIWGANPSLDASQIKTLLVENVDPLAALSGKVGFGGRLNVAKAAQAAATNPPASGWPVTPPPPSDPPTTGDSDGDGTSTGGGSTPVVPGPPVTLDNTPPVVNTVNPKAARVGSIGKIRFRVRCNEACSVKVRASADLAGMPALKGKATVKANQTRTLSVQFRGKRLNALKSALEHGEVVKVHFVLTVTDKSNNRTTRTFTVKLSR